MLIVALHQEVSVLEDQALDRSYLVRANASVPCQSNGIEPELALSLGRPDVDVRRLSSLIGVEVEPATTDP
jgi:hypothetical protein